MSYYSILGIEKNATPKEIRQAYLAKALIFHPDKGNTPDGEKFKGISEAYETLKDPVKRKRYDSWLMHQEQNPIISLGEQVGANAAASSSAIVRITSFDLGGVIIASNISALELQKLALESEALSLALLKLLKNPENEIKFDGFELCSIGEQFEQVALQIVSDSFLYSKLRYDFAVQLLSKAHSSVCLKILKTSKLADALNGHNLLELVKKHGSCVLDLIKQNEKLYTCYQEALLLENPRNYTVEEIILILEKGKIGGSRLIELGEKYENLALALIRCPHLKISDLELSRLGVAHEKVAKEILSKDLLWKRFTFYIAIFDLAKKYFWACQNILSNPELYEKLSGLYLYKLVQTNPAVLSLFDNSAALSDCYRAYLGLNEIVTNSSIKVLDLNKTIGLIRSARLSKSDLLKMCSGSLILSLAVLEGIQLSEFDLISMAEMHERVAEKIIQDQKFYSILESNYTISFLTNLHRSVCVLILQNPVLANKLSGQSLHELIEKYGSPIHALIVSSEKLAQRLQDYILLKHATKIATIKLKPGKVDEVVGDRSDQLYGVGLFYQDKDIALAAYYYRKAAQEGNGLALKALKALAKKSPRDIYTFWVAEIFAESDNPLFDEEKGRKWFVLAADHGNAEAGFSLLNYISKLFAS